MATSRSGAPGGASRALSSGQNFHASPAVIGRNDGTVTTAADGSDISSFLGAMPNFSGHQKAGDIFARETFDQPDKYADEVQFLTGILDFFIVDQVSFVYKTLITRTLHTLTHNSPSPTIRLTFGVRKCYHGARPILCTLLGMCGNSTGR